jgi:hypothetical protein
MSKLRSDEEQIRAAFHKKIIYTDFLRHHVLASKEAKERNGTQQGLYLMNRTLNNRIALQPAQERPADET